MRGRATERRVGLRGRGWPAPALVVAALATAMIVLAPAADARSAGKPSSGTSPTPVPAPHQPYVPHFAVAAPGVPDDLSGMTTLSAALGTRPDTLVSYAAWASVPDFPAAGAARVAAWGATPEITWEPWDPAAGATQSRYTLQRIARGSFDTYIRRWAQEIASYGKPVVLRFAHEMNGSWYPWAAGANGNTAADYVAAWRHVWTLFAQAGAGNATWVWSPNVPYTGSVPLASLYPGDAYVDVVALDGYNWAGIQPGSTWQSFGDVFAAGVSQLQALTSRSLVIGEVGCPETGGDKAAWVSDMFATLAAHPEIRGLTWFDFAKEADWRIDSSPGSLAAFASGLPSWPGPTAG